MKIKLRKKSKPRLALPKQIGGPHSSKHGAKHYNRKRDKCSPSNQTIQKNGSSF